VTKSSPLHWTSVNFSPAWIPAGEKEFRARKRIKPQIGWFIAATTILKKSWSLSRSVVGTTTKRTMCVLLFVGDFAFVLPLLCFGQGDGRDAH
jgi:hypothetical protein